MKTKTYYKEIYPHLWKLYVFLYNERRGYERRFDFLLAFNGISLIIFFQIFGELIRKGVLLFYIPLIFLVIPVLLFFYHMIPRRTYIPWFGKEEIKKIYYSKKNFHEEAIRDVYGTIPHLNAYADNKKKLIRLSLNILFLALVSSIIVSLIYKNYIYLPIIIFILSIEILILINFLFNKEYLKKSSAPEVEKFFDDWKKEEIFKKR